MLLLQDGCCVHALSGPTQRNALNRAPQALYCFSKPNVHSAPDIRNPEVDRGRQGLLNSIACSLPLFLFMQFAKL